MRSFCVRNVRVLLRSKVSPRPRANLTFSTSVLHERVPSIRSFLGVDVGVHSTSEFRRSVRFLGLMLVFVPRASSVDPFVSTDRTQFRTIPHAVFLDVLALEACFFICSIGEALPRFAIISLMLEFFSPAKVGVAFISIAVGRAMRSTSVWSMCQQKMCVRR